MDDTQQSKIAHNEELHILENTPEYHGSIPMLPELWSAPDIVFTYNPDSIQQQNLDLIQDISLFTSSDIIISKIDTLTIELNKILTDVRWKMKQKSIQLFGVSKVSDDELIRVYIHELAHYIDIYSLKKTVFIDPSQRFYDISWNSTKTIRPGETLHDFVSGYAMSNKYEDFAESLSYYIFANEEMRNRAKSSYSLSQKYLFFQKNIFKSGEFQQTDFSLYPAKKYYWDITKKHIKTKKFLEYIEKKV